MQNKDQQLIWESYIRERATGVRPGVVATDVVNPLDNTRDDPDKGRIVGVRDSHPGIEKHIYVFKDKLTELGFTGQYGPLMDKEVNSQAGKVIPSQALQLGNMWRYTKTYDPPKVQGFPGDGTYKEAAGFITVTIAVVQEELESVWPPDAPEGRKDSKEYFRTVIAKRKALRDVCYLSAHATNPMNRPETCIPIHGDEEQWDIEGHVLYDGTGGQLINNVYKSVVQWDKAITKGCPHLGEPIPDGIERPEAGVFGT